MSKSPAGEVRVDEGRLGADTPEAKEQENEGVRVIDVNGNDIPRSHAKPATKPRTAAQCQVISLRKRVALVLEADEGPVGRLRRPRPLLQYVKLAEPVSPLPDCNLYPGLHNPAE